ncbi:MAG: FHA domain-containing protein [Planctomycetota bacterium]|jgi:hypothetical protein
MEYHPRIEEFLALHGEMQKEAFLEKFKEPFLMIELSLSDENPDAFHTLDGTSKPERPTQPISKRAQIPAHPIVAQVTKSDRNSFHNMVTVGRATNNDIIIQHASVSKFHAYFRTDPKSGEVSIADAGSSYGSELNGMPILKDDPHPIQSGAVLIFANSVRVVFLSAVEFFNSMHRYVS